MEFVPLLAMGSLVFQLINFLKYVTNADWNAAVTQLVAWVSGFVVVTLFAHSDFAAGMQPFGGIKLDKANGWSLLLIGVSAASMLGVANEFKKSIDRTDSAAKPDLLPVKRTPTA